MNCIKCDVEYENDFGLGLCDKCIKKNFDQDKSNRPIKDGDDNIDLKVMSLIMHGKKVSSDFRMWDNQKWDVIKPFLDTFEPLVAAANIKMRTLIDQRFGHYKGRIRKLEK